MKKYSVCLAIFSFSLLKIYSQGIPENVNQMIDKSVSSKIVVEKTKIASDTLGKVFSGMFYKADVTVNLNNSNTIFPCYFVFKDGKLTELEDLTEDRQMNFLFSLLRNDFYLKNENDVKLFETALDKIYPLGWSDADAKGHLKIANKWYFIRGKFFDAKRAFIVTLDGNSKITSIEYNLSTLEKK